MSRTHQDPCYKRGEAARSFGRGGWSTVQYSRPTVGEQNDATQDQGISVTRTHPRRVHVDGHGDGSLSAVIHMSARMWEEDGKEEDSGRRRQQQREVVCHQVIDMSAHQPSASAARPTFHFQEWPIWLSQALVQIGPTAQSSLCSGSARLS